MPSSTSRRRASSALAESAGKSACRCSPRTSELPWSPKSPDSKPGSSANWLLAMGAMLVHRAFNVWPKRTRCLCHVTQIDQPGRQRLDVGQLLGDPAGSDEALIKSPRKGQVMAATRKAD